MNEFENSEFCTLYVSTTRPIGTEWLEGPGFPTFLRVDNLLNVDYSIKIDPNPYENGLPPPHIQNPGYGPDHNAIKLRYIE